MAQPLQLTMVINGDITLPFVPGSVGVVTVSAYNPGASDVALQSAEPTFGAPAPNWAGDYYVLSRNLTAKAGQLTPVLIYTFVSHCPTYGQPAFLMTLGAAVNDTAGNQFLTSQSVQFAPSRTPPQTLPVLSSGQVVPDEDFSQSFNSSYFPFFL